MLAKLFDDRQLTPDARVINYLVPRMRRSFETAQRLVAEIDRAALARRRPITLAIAALFGGFLVVRIVARFRLGLGLGLGLGRRLGRRLGASGTITPESIIS